ncbi:hypothetical protein G0Q06_06900 [Puniceicoccales bacterium CK1056]|uniref:Uncharacterized protein n=1 Tax=Oceanipulchritudo coccoides TaxID=2706888 RepID=A0A6B2M395_9BACT|nr:hypothetical protein [Oceanipulchritudo coccoides]NDV62170.1 hypothetical protein [Oceanipulchritudo coccoides]
MESMPGAKDITGDIGKLRNRNVLPRGEAPVLPNLSHQERKIAFNALSFFFWTLVCLFLVLQLVFLAWLTL